MKAFSRSKIGFCNLLKIYKVKSPFMMAVLQSPTLFARYTYNWRHRTSFLKNSSSPTFFLESLMTVFSNTNLFLIFLVTVIFGLLFYLVSLTESSEGPPQID